MEGLAGILGPTAPPRQRERASDRVHAELVEAIRDLRLPPGTEISEKDLTAALQVSRTPVREALSRLAEAGLVTVRPQIGTHVAEIRLSEVREAQFTRELLELGVLTELANGEGLDLARVRANLALQREAMAAGDTFAFFAADEGFHEAMFDLGGHAGSWSLLRPMKVQLDRVRRLSVPDSDALKEIYAEHSAIADAVEAGEVDTLRRIATHHVRRALGYIDTLTAEQPSWVVE